MAKQTNKSKLKAALSIVVVVVAVLAGLSFNMFFLQNRPVDPQDKQLVEVIIPDMSSARQVSAILKSAGLIKSESSFFRYCQWYEIDSKLKPGRYLFSRSQPLREIAMMIAEGKIEWGSITVPEGYTVKQIGELLISKNIVSAADWEAALQKNYDYSFLPKEGGGQKQRLEGFLFPDTYFIEDNISAEAMIRMMLDNFARIWNTEFADMARPQNLNEYEAVTVASLIETEAQVASERKTISGVIQNRLQANMPLQIDTTVLYSLDIHKEQLTYADLKVDSPYNTYKIIGLPPGPIACPGRQAIDAALNPETNSYYYYVAKGDGSHYFSQSFAEHLAAQQKYQ